jgi:hypothetical protein
MDPPPKINLKPASIPERLVRRYLAQAAWRLGYGVLLLVLMPIVVIIAVGIFAVLGVVIFGSYAFLGAPPAPLGLVFSLGWFFGSLLVLLLVLRRGHRWLARLIAIADAPAAWIDPYRHREIIEAKRPTAWGEAADPTTFRDRVRAADARLSQDADADHPVIPNRTG